MTLVESGRGLSFWFDPTDASLSEPPMDDRELVFLIKGQTKSCLNRLVREFANAYQKDQGVHDLLGSGLSPVQSAISAGFSRDPTLDAWRWSSNPSAPRFPLWP
ncbi:hypothetical protein [Pelagimonas varians]|uniref:Uncharacterized protein n=1 Tax=Pelagimonas varians TaxID=696760 RepID=A0A238KNF6_9RHOB|nr:hypothetical protein [Pelagimonas varians]PYG28890.1 hypothetical protein C8N36_110113 [Pelagimonas varians]SMX44221.1 hypothetical protein PEV8663_02820 [Pelagimonas varians]